MTPNLAYELNDNINDAFIEEELEEYPEERIIKLFTEIQTLNSLLSSKFSHLKECRGACSKISATLGEIRDTIKKS